MTMWCWVCVIGSSWSVWVWVWCSRVGSIWSGIWSSIWSSGIWISCQWWTTVWSPVWSCRPWSCWPCRIIVSTWPVSGFAAHSQSQYDYRDYELWRKKRFPLEKECTCYSERMNSNVKTSTTLLFQRKWHLKKHFWFYFTSLNLPSYWICFTWMLTELISIWNCVSRTFSIRLYI